MRILCSMHCRVGHKDIVCLVWWFRLRSVCQGCDAGYRLGRALTERGHLSICLSIVARGVSQDQIGSSGNCRRELEGRKSSIANKHGVPHMIVAWTRGHARVLLKQCL